MNYSNASLLKGFRRAQENLVTQQSDFSLSSLNEMIERGQIDLSPEYQRRERWKENKQSELIESFILNVPVPPVYLSEDEYGRYSVIDGKQRLTAIHKFISGRLKLRHLKSIPELNGLLYSDLPETIQNALIVRPYIRAITLLRQSDPDLKFEVFLRLNKGSSPLKPQEIRNVAYAGPLNDALMRLSENNILRDGLKIKDSSSTAYNNMDDVEHVLRFFTVENNWRKMNGSLSNEMDSFMASHQYVGPAQLQEKIDLFNNTIASCAAIFSDKVFNKPVGNSWRDQLISPLFDAEMVAVSMLDRPTIERLINHTDEVLDGVRNLYQIPEFESSVTQATNTPSSVRARIDMMYNMLQGF